MAQQSSPRFQQTAKGFVLLSEPKPKCVNVTRTGARCTKNSLEGTNRCKQHQGLVENRFTELPSQPLTSPQIPSNSTSPPLPQTTPPSEPAVTFQLSPAQKEANEKLHRRLNMVEEGSSQAYSEPEPQMETEVEVPLNPAYLPQPPTQPFDPRSFKSKAVEMALEEGSDDGSYYGEEPREVTTMSPGVGLACGGYYMLAGIIEDASRTFMSRPLTGFERKLRASPEVQTYLPIVMQKLLEKYGLGEVSPETALLGATATIAFGCYITSPPNAPAEESAEFTAEESL